MAAEEDLYSQKFRNGLNILAQQKMSRLRPAVMVDTGVGKTHWADAIGLGAAQQIVDRYGDTPNMDISTQRTRIDLAGYDFGKMIDKVDALKTLHSLESRYVQATNYAMNREMDSVINAAFFADALRGEEGGTTVTFPAGNQVAVNSWAYGSGSGNTGLTVSKLIEAKVKLLEGEVDEEEEIFCAISAKQLGNLLATTEATSADYNSVKSLVDGRVNTFMGMTFIRTQLLSADSNSYRRVPVWQRSGMSLAIGGDITVEVSKRADKRYNWQVYTMMFLGAARVEDAKVIEIKCSE